MKTPLLLLTFTLGPMLTLSQGISPQILQRIRTTLASADMRSWEIGTYTQTLLELDTPSYSVFYLHKPSIPPPSSNSSDYPPSLDAVLSIAQRIVSARSENAERPRPLMPDGSAADPASNGVSVLIANWTGRGERDGVDYAGAAREQLEFLLESTPRSSDGAISHRTEDVSLWWVIFFGEDGLSGGCAS